jgi:hypothetical protein
VLISMKRCLAFCDAEKWKMRSERLRQSKKAPARPRSTFRHNAECLVTDQGAGTVLFHGLQELTLPGPIELTPLP